MVIRHWIGGVESAHTLEGSLYCHFKRKDSSASLHAVVFGGICWKSSSTNSKRAISTATDGSSGAQGNKPCSMRTSGAGQQLQVLIDIVVMSVFDIR
jgi:hypothetical protein